MKRFLLFFGITSLLFALIIAWRIFSPVVFQELRYAIAPPDFKKAVKPVSKDFGLVIPKIGANAKVIPGVNPNDSREYQLALSQGVAHAKGTSLPGTNGQIFIFAHSAGSPIEANQFNAVFYLLNKLEKKDQILIYYQGKKFVYEVTAKKIVNPQEASYLQGKNNGQTLALMTCWPAGTTVERLIIFAKRVN